MSVSVQDKDYTLAQYIQQVHHHQVDPSEILEYYLQKAKDHDSPKAYLRIEEEYVRAHASAYAKKPLAGAPLAVKDLIMVKNTVSSCGSAMLSSYKAPYTATCMNNLERHG